ncbi:MAG: 4-hydroxy-tetrahydrodipicolinate reductase [Acidimicrobiia bacterium]|nr:4-hydroxy-tetrahydrodipicolinate reductase [Acidimicrobiia bacterium]
MTRVGVLGAAGRMGSLVCETIEAADGLDLVAAVDLQAGLGSITPSGLEISPDIGTLAVAGADVAVDFTHPESAFDNVLACVEAGIHAVVGTSGFTQGRLDELAARLGSGPPNVVVVPNFAVGAVLMMHFAEKAAPFFDRAEVIELHHDGKADAPSGTAISTAERLARAREGGWPARGDSEESLAGARGGQVGQVRVHAVRLPGIVASQEVLLGTTGQTLTIRHDTFDRSAFMPGVVAAVRAVSALPGLTVGLESVLGLT